MIHYVLLYKSGETRDATPFSLSQRHPSLSRSIHPCFTRKLSRFRVYSLQLYSGFS
jgi:hypothetical protein